MEIQHLMISFMTIASFVFIGFWLIFFFHWVLKQIGVTSQLGNFIRKMKRRKISVEDAYWVKEARKKGMSRYDIQKFLMVRNYTMDKIEDLLYAYDIIEKERQKLIKIEGLKKMKGGNKDVKTRKKTTYQQ